MARIASFVKLAVLASLLLVTSAAPAPAPSPDALSNNGPEIIEIIAPAGIAQETLESLNLGEPNSEQSERNKRTIGILRQLFPGISQMIDQKIQQIVSFLFRTFGRTLLQGALGGNSGNSGGGGGDSSVSVQLPTYNAEDDEDDDDDDDDDDKDSDSNTADSSISSRVNTADSATDKVKPDNIGESSTESISSTSDSALNDDDKNTIDATLKPDTSSESSSLKDELSTTVTATANARSDDDDGTLSEAESQVNEVRVQFNDQPAENVAEAKSSDGDQESAASGGNNGAIDDLSLDDADADATDDNRNKRFLSFGLGSDGSGGSGGGSGNFLFDIIRRPAESMARAAGQAFRIITGTDSIGLGITATHTATRDVRPPVISNQLIAGSGGTEQTDESANASDGESVGKGDGYTEGIPGPVTRLLILANRGLSNLVQDLILRLAQTSERIVNFKARLITSII